MNNQASTSGHIRGISICKSGPKLTHLFFVDDSLLFCKALVQKCYYIQGLLKTYEEASGKQLNRDKTTIFFQQSYFYEGSRGYYSNIGSVGDQTMKNI